MLKGKVDHLAILLWERDIFSPLRAEINEWPMLETGLVSEKEQLFTVIADRTQPLG